MTKKLEVALCYDKLYKQVADQIEELIVTQSLHPGDRLPSERELAEQLGISRSVVREAIRLLSVRGLVRVKAGCGTYVREPNPEDVAGSIGLLLKLRQCPDYLDNLYEIRHMIETEVAGLAAERATDDDYAAMEAALEGMAAHVDDPEAFIQHDLAFHLALATATRNDLFNVLLSAISDLWSKGVLLAYQAPGAAEDALAYHGHILKQVKQGDPDQARQAMREHICHAQSLAEAVSHRVDAS